MNGGLVYGVRFARPWVGSGRRKETTLAQSNTPIPLRRCTLGFSTRHVLRRFAGNDPARLRFVRARFAGPICPGETLLTRMWQEEGRVVFEALVKDKVVLSHAYARIEPIQVAKL